MRLFILMVYTLAGVSSESSFRSEELSLLLSSYIDWALRMFLSTSIGRSSSSWIVVTLLAFGLRILAAVLCTSFASFWIPSVTLIRLNSWPTDEVETFEESRRSTGSGVINTSFLWALSCEKDRDEPISSFSRGTFSCSTNNSFFCTSCFLMVSYFISCMLKRFSKFYWMIFSLSYSLWCAFLGLLLAWFVNVCP